MDTSDVTSRETSDSLANLRVSKRLRKRPTYFMPGNKIETNTEDEIAFRAVVTDNQGFKDFQDSASFQGTSAWRLNHVLNRLTRELKVDPKAKYAFTVWNEGTESKA